MSNVFFPIKIIGCLGFGLLFFLVSVKLGYDIGIQEKEKEFFVMANELEKGGKLAKSYQSCLLEHWREGGLIE